jgi:hypothetical protein
MAFMKSMKGAEEKNKTMFYNNINVKIFALN